jgi:hypothetical protein
MWSTLSNLWSLSTPAKTKLLMPQVTFQPLPVLEDDEIENDINNSVTVNFVNGEDSWTLVQRCKKKN